MLAPKDIIWRETVDSVFESTDENAQYPDSFSRFHISHLGMSAFDTVILVLINDGEERERYIWQYNEKTIQDYTAPLGSLEACAKEAVSWFRELNK